MADVKDIKAIIRAIIGETGNLPFTGKVTEVQQQTCSIKLKNGFVASDVKLKATITEGNEGTIIYPKVGSTIHAIGLNGSVDNLIVIKVDEVERVSYVQEGLEVLIDSTDGKISIKNESVSLFEMINELTALLKLFKVFTPAGPSGTPLPDTIAAIIQVETKFNQLLK